MNLEQLKAFELVARLGSFSKAAKTAGLAQSLMSRKLSQLEEEWGDRLFHRTGRGVVLTEFGQRIQPHVQILLAQADRLGDEVKNAAGVPTGTVHLGILPSLAREVVALLFSDMKATAPAVRLQITEGLSGQLDAQLASGRLDMVIVNRYGSSLGSEEELLGKVDSFVVGRPGASLLQGKTVDFRELAGVPLVLPAAPNGLRTFLEQVARQQGIHLDVALEVNSVATMRTVAMSGDAFTISSFPNVEKEVAGGNLQALMLVNPGICRTIALSVTKQHPLSRAGRLVQSRLRQLVPALINDGIAVAKIHLDSL
jgi:DNA-binding transcriptional LysR family regulator